LRLFQGLEALLLAKTHLQRSTELNVIAAFAPGLTDLNRLKPSAGLVDWPAGMNQAAPFKDSGYDEAQPTPIWDNALFLIGAEPWIFRMISSN